MKFNYHFLACVTLMVVALPGCGGKKSLPEKNIKLSKNAEFSNVNIPLEDNIQASNLSQDVEEFVEVAQAQEQSNDFAWVNEDQKGTFKNVYFDFDQYSVQPEQQNQIDYDIDQVKKSLTQAAENNEDKVVVVYGNSCHSAGSRTYNLALSEKRAKAVADHFVAAGIAKENIKVVGRGQEVPVVIDGKSVTGSREEQWPNRRVEVAVINS